MKIYLEKRINSQCAFLTNLHNCDILCKHVFIVRMSQILDGKEMVHFCDCM